MMRRTLSLMTVLLLAGPWAHWARAQSIPTAIPYTGSVAVNGIPFSGQGHFKFAIVDQSGTTTYWSNSALGAGSEPINDVTVVVSNGLYALELGNPDLANMLDLPPAVFANPMTFLRVWFSDGVNGFQLLSPDRQLVSVPYAYQAEKAREVSGTGTVVKSLSSSEGTPLTDDIVLDGAGNIDIQQTGNTITIVGTTGTAAATDLSCVAPCVSSSEISGPLTDALIPDLGTLSGTVTDVQIPGAIARDSEVTAAITTHSTAPGAHTLSTLAGSITDAQIPAAIARDSEVPGIIGTAVSDAVSTHSAAPGAHTLSALAGSVTDAQVPDLGTLSGILTDAQIPDLNALSGVLLDAQIPAAIARDSEVTAGVSAAIGAHSLAPGAHTLSALAGSVTDAQIPAGVARDSEVPALIGSAVSDAVTAHATAPSAHTLSALAGSVTDAQIPAAIARDSETAAAITTHSAAPGAHTLSALAGSVTDAQIPAAITRDGEVPGLIGSAVSDAVTAHAAAPNAHTLSALAGSVTDAQIPSGISRDSEVTASVSSAIGAHSLAVGAHALSVLAGSVTDAQIPAGIARDSEIPALIGTAVSDAVADHAAAPGAHTLSTLAGSVTDAQIPAAIARDSETTAAISAHSAAAGAHTLSALAGSVTDAQIPAAITRDSEVPALIGSAVSDGIATHSTATGAHNLATLAGSVTDAQVPDLGTLSGILINAQIPVGITRDTEVPGLVGTVVSDAIVAHAQAPGAHTLSALAGSVTDAQVPDLGTLSGVLVDAQIPAVITRDGEVPALIGTAVSDAIDVHSAAPNAHTLSALAGSVTDSQVPAAIARDSEVTQSVDDAIGAHAINPSAHHAKTTSFTELTDTIASAQIPSTITHGLNVTGTVTVVALAASYVRVNSDESAAIGPSTFSATCPNGANVLGGGVNTQGADDLTMAASWPNANNSWSVTVNNSSPGSLPVTVYAVCAAIQ